ncbi:GspH/FimT family pseudopilin [Novosphingobium pokkalii]|uniref:GspH/FimT family pseudopilin n=1 Tax=Novosphingobium pokkalii TaxID=1770194 RepID=UPI003631225D
MELIVALAIAALAATAVVLALPGRAATPAQEAQRLAARLAAARDLAVIGGHPVAVTIDPSGYAFAVRRDGQWTVPADPRLHRRVWPVGLAVTGAATARRAVFDAMGLPNAPFAVRLRADGATVQVLVAGDGAVTLGGAAPP